MRAVAISCVLVGCGLPKDTLLVELSGDELGKVCKDLPGPQTFVCKEEGIIVQFSIGEDCEGQYAGLPGDCTATVDDLKTCDADKRKAYEEDPCRSDSPESCGVLEGCLLDVD